MNQKLQIQAVLSGLPSSVFDSFLESHVNNVRQVLAESHVNEVKFVLAGPEKDQLDDATRASLATVESLELAGFEFQYTVATSGDLRAQHEALLTASDSRFVYLTAVDSLPAPGVLVRLLAFLEANADAATATDVIGVAAKVVPVTSSGGEPAQDFAGSFSPLSGVLVLRLEALAATSGGDVEQKRVLLDPQAVVFVDQRFNTETYTLEEPESYRKAPGESGPVNEDSPFLTVVMRTQARRRSCLIEALQGLYGQSDKSFELNLVGHNLSPEKVVEVQDILASFPQPFQQKVNFLQASGGNRSTPLNVGYQAAHGEYVAMLDDDDLPFANWVETFHELAKANPGQVVRVNVAMQLAVEKENGDVIADSELAFPFPAEFQLWQHLQDNRTPNMALAVPASVYREQDLKFDETLDTHEDWDFIVRAASEVGVASSPKVTALYRWWTDAESSRTLHDEAEHEANRQTVRAHQDAAGLFFSGAELQKLRNHLDQVEADSAAQAQREAKLREDWKRSLEEMKVHFQLEQIKQAEATVQALEAREAKKLRDLQIVIDHEAAYRIELLRHIAHILDTKAWKTGIMISKAANPTRRLPKVRLVDFLDYDVPRLERAIGQLQANRSYRLGLKTAQKLNKFTRRLPGK